MEAGRCAQKDDHQDRAMRPPMSHVDLPAPRFPEMFTPFFGDEAGEPGRCQAGRCAERTRRCGYIMRSRSHPVTQRVTTVVPTLDPCAQEGSLASCTNPRCRMPMPARELWVVHLGCVPYAEALA